MNKHGQSLVLFIIIIPISIIVTALVVDTGINMYNEKKLKNVTEDVITNILENDLTSDKYEERAKNIYEKNKIDTDYLMVTETYDGIEVYNSTLYYSLFNSIFRNGTRQTTVNARGRKDDNGKITVEFIEDDVNENK